MSVSYPVVSTAHPFVMFLMFFGWPFIFYTLLTKCGFVFCLMYNETISFLRSVFLPRYNYGLRYVYQDRADTISLGLILVRFYGSWNIWNVWGRYFHTKRMCRYSITLHHPHNQFYTGNNWILVKKNIDSMINLNRMLIKSELQYASSCHEYVFRLRLTNSTSGQFLVT